jgi:hypothetical protein
MSEIKTDKLTGKTTAGNVTVTSEGGSATMQMQQGLLKVWRLDETLATTSLFSVDSINTSSTTDVSTGRMYISFSNAFAATNYPALGTVSGGSVDDNIMTHSGSCQTDRDEITNYDTAYKDQPLSYSAFGDLA